MKADGRGMMEDVVARLKELTDVDFERDSAKRENEFSSLRSLLSQFIESEMRSCSMYEINQIKGRFFDPFCNNIIRDKSRYNHICLDRRERNLVRVSTM